ncbi:MAG: hypothetical protein KDK53_16970 [Maritimibacter sp.]|nr:hypothetical protein [Maritimibacter sp.]
MFWELIATLVAGVAAAGVVLALGKLLRGRLPKWLMPVAAGAAMIAMTIYNEYGWFPRTQTGFPEGLEIVETVESRAWYRPWTYVAPYVERFVAVDTVTVRTHPAQPDQKLADVYLFGRWAPVHKLPVLVDCAGWRRAALADGIGFEDDGSVTGADWVGATEADGILATLCGDGT